jgi:hypothetical protein
MYIMIQSNGHLGPGSREGVVFCGAASVTGASPEELARLLAKVEVFGALSEEEILWLARRVPEMRLGRGQVLWGPTQESRSIFVMIEGRLRDGGP